MGVQPLQGVCRALHSHASRNEKSDVVAKRRRVSVSYGRLCGNSHNFCRERGYILQCSISSIMYTFCTRVCTEQPIPTLAAYLEVLHLHLHPPLVASKRVLSSWSLGVIFYLVTRTKLKQGTGITGWYPAGTSLYHGLHIYVSKWYSEVCRVTTFTCSSFDKLFGGW